jgi:two-component system, OmpR family, sensor histidine kinase KdpD
VIVPRIERGALLRFLIVAVPSLAAATLAVSVLQDRFGVPNPSALYLLAVVAVAVASGTRAAAVASVAAFLLYNFFFVEPRYTFTVANLGELLNLFLLLFASFVVGQLAARQRARAEDAIAREREARALFDVSRELATRESTPAVLDTIAKTLRGEAAMDRVWISLGTAAGERVAADTGERLPRPSVGLYQVLQRTPGDAPARWSRVHQTGAGTRAATDHDVYRIRMEAAEESYGSIWAARPRRRGDPTRSQTRLLSAAADQIGQALRQDRLAAEAKAVEIARQSDALKSALLQSVSHDLRTPLATIRAAAGSLGPDSGLSPEDQQASADAIDREVEYLDRLVTNLLDLSRIEAGALRADIDAFELDDLVGQTVDRLRPRLADRPVDVELDAPPVDVDPVFLGEAVTNAVENAIKYTPPGTPIRLTATDGGDGFVRLSVEDAGPGVPDEALDRLFDKFYRVPGGRRGSRAGTGIGLAVVQGLVAAMGGRASARRSDLGGLAIDLDLPITSVSTTVEHRTVP